MIAGLHTDGSDLVLRGHRGPEFLRRECARLGLALPPAGEYGAGLVFLPRAPMQADKVRALLHSIVEEEGQRLIGWRDVPTADHHLGASGSTHRADALLDLVGDVGYGLDGAAQVVAAPLAGDDCLVDLAGGDG